MNIKRPRRVHEEDEDELMEFQEQFLRDSQQPSVKIVRKKHETKTNNNNNPIPEVVEKKVKFQSNLEIFNFSFLILYSLQLMNQKLRLFKDLHVFWQILL
jgi:hypothetical protein